MTVPFSLSTSRTDPPMARAKDSTIDMPKPDEPRPWLRFTLTLTFFEGSTESSYDEL